MKALTIRQPWASLICPGPGIAPVKTIETARPKWSYRGPVLIHAAARRLRIGQLVPWYDAGFHCAAALGTGRWTKDGPIIQWGVFPLGAVIGVARITDCLPVVADLGGPDDPLPRVCVTSRGLKLMRPFVFPSEDISDQEPYGDFTPGTHALVLDDIVSLPRPIPAVGRLGLWNPDAELIAAVEAQIGTRP